ncbi:MAG: CDP-diacylglycerol--glycerol-3-phosphate 3-phosphatidyltransferase [Deltaproteobacteria bacterium SM23_61]|nr:MAG: CDP-diacylglycerol--glycerol-3-phosphate 3-phosphatidyltransferase [Deltaproteobacteria bacterium SM23_61]
MEIVAKGQQRATIRNIPNFLTVLRIFSIPVIVFFLTSPGPGASFMAALVFCIASFTDLLDGYLARQQKAETAIGKLLDPMADKLLILSGMIMLIPLGRIPAWMVVLIIGREVAITGLRGIASAEGVVIAASRLGKAKMVLQSFALGWLMLHYEYLGINFHVLGMLFLWVALAITLWSGIDYFWKFYQGVMKK